MFRSLVLAGLAVLAVLGLALSGCAQARPSACTATNDLACSLRSNLVVRLIACDWQVRCGAGGVCAVKWSCPWNEPRQ